MRVQLHCAALCCALLSPVAQAAPFTVEDMLKIETLSQMAASPDGRWLVIQSHAGQADARRFDYDAMYPFATSRLRIVDLAHPGPATPLLPFDAAVGYTAGPFSPSGQRMLVSRLRDHRWEAGVVELASHKVHWLGVGLDLPLFGRSAAWRSETQIVAIVTPLEQPHVLLRRGSEPMATLEARWRATALEGGPSVTAIGSGRHLGEEGSAPCDTLALIDLTAGTTTALAAGDFIDLELSPTGRFVAAVAEGADVQPRASDSVRGGTAMRRRDLVLADLGERTAWRPCADCDLSPHLLAWSVSDDRLLVYARQPGQGGDDGGLRVIDARAEPAKAATALGGVRPAIDYTNEGYEIIQAGWVANQPVALGVIAKDAQAGVAARWWRLGNGDPSLLLPSQAATPERVLAAPDGSLLSMGAGRVLSLRPGAERSEPDFTPFSPLPSPSFGDGSRVQVATLVAGRTIVGLSGGHLMRVDSSGPTDLGPAPGDLRLATAAGAAVSASRDPHGVSVITVQAGRRMTPVLTLNPQLSKIDVGEVRPVRHQTPGGGMVTSWVMLPPNWDPAHLPPLVVIPYPRVAPFSAETPPHEALPGLGLTPISSQVIAAQGYAVLYPSVLRDPEANAPSDQLAAKILAAVDAVGTAKLADVDRVALWGHSFGGYTVLAAAAQSPRFKAVIASSGVVDQFSAWGQVRGNGARTRPEDGLAFNFASGYLETGQMRVGAPPWAAPERYIRNSPLLQADKITAPVLLAYGDQDLFSFTQGEEMFSALYRQGKDAKLLTFWGEGHVVLAPGNIRRLYAEGLAWLDDALRDRRPRQAGDPVGP